MMKVVTLGIVLALTPGCSILGLTPPPKHAPTNTYPYCTDNASTVTADGLVAGLGTLILLAMGKDSASAEGMLIVGVPTAVFAGSLVYGEIGRRSCVAARAEGDRLLVPPYRAEP